MQLKDYYTILELSPSASLDDVKKAYRKLAHQYHPDKKANDPYAAALFAEIKEAYETLSNPAKKDIYLQQRWYAQSINRKNSQDVITPVSLLKKMLELDKYVSKIDIHRMNKIGLHDYLMSIFSDETIEKINSFKEPDISNSIAEAALKSSRHLDWKYVRSFAERLSKLNMDEHSQRSIDKYVEHARRNYYWNKFMPFVILIIVSLICLLIYFISN